MYRSVSVYSTRGGTSGYAFLAMSPSFYSSRNCPVSILFVIFGV